MRFLLALGLATVSGADLRVDVIEDKRSRKQKAVSTQTT